MDLSSSNNHRSPSSFSSTASTTPLPLPTATTTTATTAASDDPMHSWWESISKARSCIHSLSSILSSSESASLSSLADSDRPALSLLSSFDTYAAISAAFSSSQSGSYSDQICQWLYETYLTADPHLRLVVLSYLPILAGLYLSRIHSDPSPSLAGFEAVLLVIYSAEVKSRSGKPVTISIPDLAQSSLYHAPRSRSPRQSPRSLPSGVVCPPLEPQLAVKSTKRAIIVGVALDCYYCQISQMPAFSKLELCRFAAAWAGQDCSWQSELYNSAEFEEKSITNFDDEIEVNVDDVSEGLGHLMMNGHHLEPKGARIPLPWELLQPILRILGHCLLAPLNSLDVKDSASIAVRCLYARANHELQPQAILATKSLIQLDNRARLDAKAAAVAAAAATVSSNANTPSKARKPEILLVSK